MYKTIKRLIRSVLTPWRRTPFIPEGMEEMEDIYKQGKSSQNPLGFEFGARYGKVQAGPSFLRPRGAGGDQAAAASESGPSSKSEATPAVGGDPEGFRNPASKSD
jgi:hypothetical protein